MLHSKIGKAVQTDHGSRIETQRGQRGYAIFGPYLRLPPGRYSVEFSVLPERGVADDAICCNIDVAVSASKILAEKSFSAAELIALGGRVVFEFESVNDGLFEFRVFSTGALALSVMASCPVTADGNDTLSYYPVLKKGRIPTNEFFKDNFQSFLDMHAKGFEFDDIGDDIVSSYSGTRFCVAHTDDFQLMNEIFLGNDYNFSSSREKIMVDIGMNVGLTSIFFANNPSVREVYSFEPFAIPFHRALKNFSLNPSLAAKIKPSHFGLGGQDDVVSVLSNEGHTTGVSIRGASSGNSEEIHIKNAADVIEPLADRALSENLDLIVKVDCEGSEFAIFETLERRGLLSKIDALAIEWHKWWSSEKTQADLIRPLLGKNFIVVDRTNPTDPWAGFLYAIRTYR